MAAAPRSHVLFEANYRQLLDRRPNVAVLPWGATEAHNMHLPHGTDVIEAAAVAERAADLAADRGARPIVLPVIPYGNNAQQQDQVATIHLSTATALSLLRDVVLSLKRQGIDRLLIVNGHGGNEFKPLIRDLMLESGVLIVVIDFWRVRPEEATRIFAVPGDHAGELETSLLMHLRPEPPCPGSWERSPAAGRGRRGRGRTSIPTRAVAIRRPRRRRRGRNTSPSSRRRSPPCSWNCRGP
jgi:creatinine amidohydrolase